MNAPAKFYVVMRDARNSSTGERGDAYLGNDLRNFSTLDVTQAHAFDDEYEAERYRDHWRGWYRGFHGGAVIDMVALAKVAT